MGRTILRTITAALTLAACGGAEEGSAVREVEAVTPSRASTAAAAPARPDAPPSPVGETSAPAADAPRAQVAASPAEAPAAPAPVAASVPAPVAETQSDAAAILRRAEQAYDAVRSLEADFAQELSVPLLNTTQRTRGKMYIRRPDRFLMRFTDPAGDVVVADGRYVWLYYPSTDAKQVIRASVADGQQLDLQKEFLSDPTTRFNAVLNGSERVGGRAAHVLTLTPRAPSGYSKVRIWVDAQDALVRRFEITEANESVRRLDLSNLKPNAPVADQLFRFTPPAGTQVFSR